MLIGLALGSRRHHGPRLAAGRGATLAELPALRDALELLHRPPRT